MTRRNPRILHLLAAATLGVVSASAQPARAVILHATGDPAANTTAPGGALVDSGWQWQGNWAGFLATPIAPNYFITAAHVGLSFDGLQLNGQGHMSVPFPDGDPFKDFGDLRVFRTDTPFHSYAPLYGATDGTEVNKPLVVFGRGVQRGEEVRVDGTLKGWRWGEADGVKRWGENRGFAFQDYDPDTLGDDQRLLRANFDATGGANEATLGSQDSGGGLFIQVNGQWKLAGINYTVSGPFRPPEGGATFNAALFDMGGLRDGNGATITDLDADRPSSFYASRIVSALPWLLGDLQNPRLIELPPTWKTNSNGDWTIAANWANGGVPNAVGARADFRTVISADRTVNLTVEQTVGQISFDDASRYTISGAGSIKLDAAPAQSAAIHVAGGSHTIAVPVTLNDPTILNVIQPTSTLTLSGALNAAGQSITKTGAGTAEVKNVRAAALTVTQGTLRVTPNGTAAGTSRVASLGVATGAKLDLSNNSLVVEHTGASPIGSWDGEKYTGLIGNVADGRDGGAWTGPGIASSAAATTNGLTALAIAEASEVLGLSGSQTQQWSGQTVDATTVLVKYTYGGDADMNGTLDSDDYFAIDSNFNLSGSVFGYTKGDFDYNGAIDSDDYFIIDSNWNNQILGTFPSSALAPSALRVAAVPEPATALALAAVAGALSLRRRRR